jgi:hypothetical protein
MFRNGIPRVCFYVCSTERNSELFSLPLKYVEGNSKSLLLVLVKRTEFQVIFSSAEGFGTEFQEFSVLWNSQNSVGNHHLFRLFRLPRNTFFVGKCQPCSGMVSYRCTVQNKVTMAHLHNAEPLGFQNERTNFIFAQWLFFGVYRTHAIVLHRPLRYNLRFPIPQKMFQIFPFL